MKMRMFTALLAILLPATVSAASDAPKRLRSAAEAFKEVMGIPDKAIPQELLEKAECIVIIPDLKKGAFIVGGKYGKGFVSCRKKNGVGWSAPGSIRIEGGSVGFQIGGSETDVVFVVQNKSGENKLMEDKFTIGGGAEAAAGPVGRTASAETDAQLHAEILSYSRSRGLFAGINLSGATLRPDKDDNRALYGRDVTAREILTGGVPQPKDAASLYSQLDRYAGPPTAHR